MEDAAGLPSLVEQARKGDARAWESLYRRAYPRLLAYARRRLAGDEDAREAVSETMARAVRSIDRFRDTGNGFDAWLTGIHRHVVVDAQRRSWRQAAASDVPDSAVPGSSPEDHVLEEGERDAVRAAFARLPDDDRELLELRVVMALSAEQVGEVLGKRPGAVRMAQSRALARLRALLSQEAAIRHA